MTHGELVNRVPLLRKMAKEFFLSNCPSGTAGKKEARGIVAGGEIARFMGTLPHRYFEENHVHTFLLEHIEDFDECLRRTEQFLPHIDNWAVCDGKKPRALLKKPDIFLKHTREWVRSDHPYVTRFGINMLMEFFLEERFDPKYLEWVSSVDTEKFKNLPDGSLNARVASATPAGVFPANPEYYVRMEIAWYFATALAKHWDDALPYIEHCKLDAWTHNKTIQKSIESFRVTEKHKIFLKKLKI